MSLERKQAPPPDLLNCFPQEVCSQALRVTWLRPPGPSERKLPIPISPERQTDTQMLTEQTLNHSRARQALATPAMTPARPPPTCRQPEAEE